MDCPNCGGLMLLKTGPYGQFWSCWNYPECDIICTIGERGKVGPPSDKVTRQARRALHNQFDKLWQSGLITRSEAYTVLSQMLGIRKKHCHIRLFDKETCEKVSAMLKEKFPD